MVETKYSITQVCGDCQGRGKRLRPNTIEMIYDSCETCQGTCELNNGRIDIVRKSRMVGCVMQQFLSRYGFDVQAFTCVEDYLNQLTTPPDCIIAGYLFEEGDVHELFAGLTKRGIKTPVIVNTGLDIDPKEMPQQTYELFTGGARASIDKEVLDSVKRAISGEPKSKK